MNNLPEYYNESSHTIPKEIKNNNPKLGKALATLIGGTVGLVVGVTACFVAMGIVAGALVFTLGMILAAIAAIPLILIYCLGRMVIGDCKPLVRVFKKNKTIVDKAKEHEEDKKKLKELESLSKLLAKGIDQIEAKKKKLKNKIKEDDKKLKESTIEIAKVKII